MTTETTGAAGPGRGGRMSRQRKRDAVLRLLRGEDLESVSRALRVAAATLTAWRDAFLAAGEASLTSRPADGEELESRRRGTVKLTNESQPRRNFRRRRCLVCRYKIAPSRHVPGHNCWIMFRIRSG